MWNEAYRTQTRSGVLHLCKYCSGAELGEAGDIWAGPRTSMLLAILSLVTQDVNNGVFSQTGPHTAREYLS